MTCEGATCPAGSSRNPSGRTCELSSSDGLMHHRPSCPWSWSEPVTSKPNQPRHPVPCHVYFRTSAPLTESRTVRCPSCAQTGRRAPIAQEPRFSCASYFAPKPSREPVLRSRGLAPSRPDWGLAPHRGPQPQRQPSGGLENVKGQGSLPFAPHLHPRLFPTWGSPLNLASPDP